MLINEVNEITNGFVADNIKKLSIKELETILNSTTKSREYPEEYMDKDLVLGMILHCELLIATELKRRYDKISESN